MMANFFFINYQYSIIQSIKIFNQFEMISKFLLSLVFTSFYIATVMATYDHPLDYLSYQNLNCQRRSINEKLEIPSELPQPSDFPFDNTADNKLCSLMYNITSELGLWNHFYHHHYVTLTSLDETPYFLADSALEALEMIKDHPSMNNMFINVTEDKLSFGVYILHYISNCGWDAFYRTFDQRMTISNSSCELPKNCFSNYSFQGQDINCESNLFDHLITPINKFYRDMISIMRDIIGGETYEKTCEMDHLDSCTFYKEINKMKDIFFDLFISEKELDVMHNNSIYFYEILKGTECRISYWLNLKSECSENENSIEEMDKLIAIIDLFFSLAKVSGDINSAVEFKNIIEFLETAKSFIEYNEERINSLMQYQQMDHDMIQRYPKNEIMEMYRMAEYMILNGCEKFIREYCYKDDSQ